MKSLIYPLSLILALVMAPSAYADYGHHKQSHRYNDYQHHFDKKIRKQHRHIDRGIRDGNLTRKEVRKLEKRHARLIRLKYSFGRNGHLSYKERHTLDDKLYTIKNKIHDYINNSRFRKGHHRYQQAGNHYRVNGYAFNHYGQSHKVNRYDSRRHNHQSKRYTKYH